MVQFARFVGYHTLSSIYLLRETATRYRAVAADERTPGVKVWADTPASDPSPGPSAGPSADPSPGPSADPFDDADALEDLEEEITTLAAHIHAATHRLLTLLAEFDRRRGWELGGHRSCAHWLHVRTGIDLGAARQKVRTARALTVLPRTSEAMARGELSFSKVRALSRVATAENEEDLLTFAQNSTTAELERLVRGFRRGTRDDEAALERERHERRTLSVFPDDDGMYVVRGRLPAELGVLLMRAVEAAGDVLYREAKGGRGFEPESEATSGPTSGPSPGRSLDPESERAAGQRRADALGLVAERALAAGFGGSGEGEGDEGTPVSGSRAERYQVVLHVEPETLKADGGVGRSELEDGTRVSAETSRRLACDTGLVRMDWGQDGSVLDVGRRTRTVPPAVRRALEARDRGCRFPGCGSRFTEGHHMKHWADGGETNLGNLVLLCRHHHRLVHEEGWRMDWWGPGRPVFFDPRGGTHFDGRWKWPGDGGPGAGLGEGQAEEQAQGPAEGRGAGQGGDLAEKMDEEMGPELGGDSAEYPEPPTGDPGDPTALADALADALVEENRCRGIEPDAWTANARWKRGADIPDEVYFQALKALG